MLLRPFRLLAELGAHEDQLLAGVGPLVPQEPPKVRQLLPAVPRHLAQHRAFTVHNLVVADRQEEVLRVGVDHREGDGAVVPPAVVRVFGHVLEEAEVRE